MSPASIVRNPWLRVVVGGAISLACVVLVLKDVHLGDLWSTLAATDPLLVAAATLVLLLTAFIRGWRWQTMVAGVGHAPYWQTFASMMVGYLMNNVAPLRTGELLRVQLLHRATAISRGSLLITVTLERTLDGLFLVGCLAALVQFVAFPGWAYRAGMFVGLVFLALAVGLALASSRRLGNVVRVRLLQRLPAASSGAAIGLWGRVSAGMTAMRQPGRGTVILVQTASTWLLEVLGVYLVMAAIWLRLSPLAAVLLTVGVGLGSAIPSGPSAVGTYEFLVVSSLAIFGVQATPALALAALLHGLAFSVTTLVGLVALGMGWTWLGWTGMTRLEPQEPAASVRGVG